VPNPFRPRPLCRTIPLHPEWDGEPIAPEPPIGPIRLIHPSPEPEPRPEPPPRRAKIKVRLADLLSHYVTVGVEELGREKLMLLLKHRYHDSIADAITDLGKPDEIGGMFAGFQKYLYQSVE
jgi:hypothetical protein